MPSPQKLRAISPVEAAAVGRFFGPVIVEIDPSIPLAGSPERSQARCLARDDRGYAFVIERLLPSQLSPKVRIGHILNTLAGNGFAAVITYLADMRGETVVRYAGHLWQMAPYLPGVALARPDWVHDSWRGQAFGQTLVDLRQTAACLDHALLGVPFDVVTYIHTLVSAAEARHPDVAHSLAPLVDELAPFAQAHASLSTAFSHGDVHPLNVIWTSGGIRALIDWEFCGIKPALYDVAALVGCVGIEDPQGLEGALVQSLLTELGNTMYADAESWRWLPELVLAVRFAWMSEWLRKNDHEMIALEQCYMTLLASQKERLRTRWLAWADVSPDLI